MTKPAQTETPWTPGPWEVIVGLGDETQISSDRHSNLASLFELSDYTEQEVEANARLIAKAPEMAELLGVLLSIAEVASGQVDSYDIDEFRDNDKYPGFIEVVDATSKLLDEIHGH